MRHDVGCTQDVREPSQATVCSGVFVQSVANEMFPSQDLF